MSNPVLTAIVAVLKSVWSSLGNAITDLENHLAQDIQGLGGELDALLTAEEQQIAQDYKADLQQIAVNIQNSTPGINLSNFIPVFIAAATPVLASELTKLTAVFWNVVSTYHATSVGVTTTTGNAGNVNQTPTN